MKSSCIVMRSLHENKFVRFERMIWPSIEFKKSFLTATRKKTFWRIFRSFRPTGWSFESYFSPRVHLEKQQLKHGDNLRGFHPRRPRGSQSGWVKRRDKSFQAWGGRAPGYRLSPEYFQTLKRMLLPDKAKKVLCIIVPNRPTVSPEFFSWVRTRRLLSDTVAQFVHQAFLTRNEGTTDESKNVSDANQQEQLNLHWENSVSDGSQCIVNNRKFKMKRRRESKKSNSLTRQNNNFARASRFFVYFFAVTARLARENA